MQLKGKLIECCCYDSSKLFIQLSAEICSGNQRTLTETDERSISQQPMCLFSVVD